ncbi:MAG: alpha/beta fold hydrolase [Acidimicrobiia bacterium]|nr:alpha/beta fold hydrolase [Acidimicrobiia bacterium]
MRIRRFGTGAPRIAYLHGFTQHGGHMAELAELVGVAGLAPDLPGHGPEPHLPATMDEAIERVAEAVTGIEVLVGYSMGGRVALRVAPRLPDLRALVLVSAGSGLPDARVGERQLADDRLAEHIESGSLEHFIDEWMALPMFAGLRALDEERWEADRAMRLEGSAAGLAASLRGMGQGVVGRVADAQLASLGIQLHAIAGALDPAYVAAAEHLVGVAPRAELHIHPRAGHAVVGEDPRFVARIVRSLVTR